MNVHMGILIFENRFVVLEIFGGAQCRELDVGVGPTRFHLKSAGLSCPVLVLLTTKIR